jgi:hypothetical protein
MIKTDQNKLNIIRYTDKNFNSIKSYISEYARRYYPDTVADFTEASFNALVFDVMALIGDNLSFYLDYQANEGYLDTAIEFNNILKRGKELGYKPQFGYSAYGFVSLYVSVPAASTGLGPDDRYVPTLRKGSLFSSADGKNFILLEDVFFADSPEIRVGAVSTLGTPVSYILKKVGKVVSGDIKYIEKEITTYEDFLKVEISDSNVCEIISVYDSKGYQYYEVPNLAQNIVLQEVMVEGEDTNVILKPIVTSRRFSVDFNKTLTTLQFGSGSDSLGTDYVNNPQDTIMDFWGRNYISDINLDPYKLVNNDKFGIAPYNTTLKITYRSNSVDNVNVGVGLLTSISQVSWGFQDTLSLNQGTINNVTESLTLRNEDIISGSLVTDTVAELKNRIFYIASAQKRAVSIQDYKALAYLMPSRFGGIKRCNIVTNSGTDLKTELNFFVIGLDSEGKLAPVNSITKENLITWLTQYKMMSDRINILDAKVVNLGIDFKILIERGFDRYSVLENCISSLAAYYETVGEVGEYFSTATIYQQLKDINGVIDVTYVRILQKRGGSYSDYGFDINSNFAKDGRYIKCPKNVVFEIRYPYQDIQGSVI